MKTFKTFLIELRSHPELNVKLNPVQALKKYDSPEYFATYIEDTAKFKILVERLDKQKDMPMVTLNVQSEYDTPNGIYTYPISTMYEKYLNKKGDNFDVPHGLDKPYIAVLKKIGDKHLDLNKYTIQQLNKDLEDLSEDLTVLLKQKYPKLKNEQLIVDLIRAIYKESEINARVKTPGGIIWACTRGAAILVSIYEDVSNLLDDFDINSKMDPYENVAYDKDTYDSFVDFRDGLYSSAKFTKFESVSEQFNNGWLGRFPANRWALIWRRAAGKKFFYDSVYDSSGQKIIHSNEPFQSVFFSKRGFKVVDTPFNKTYSESEKSYQANIGKIKSAFKYQTSFAPFTEASVQNVLLVNTEYAKRLTKKQFDDYPALSRIINTIAMGHPYIVTYVPFQLPDRVYKTALKRNIKLADQLTHLKGDILMEIVDVNPYLLGVIENPATKVKKHAIELLKKYLILDDEPHYRMKFLANKDNMQEIINKNYHEGKDKAIIKKLYANALNSKRTRRR